MLAAPFGLMILPALPTGFILLCAFAAILEPGLVALQGGIDRALDAAPGLRRAQSWLGRVLGHGSNKHAADAHTAEANVTGAAVLLLVAFSLFVVGLSYLGLPIVFGTVAGWSQDLNAIAKTLPSFSSVLGEIYAKWHLEKLGVTPEMIQQATDHMREHLGAFVGEPAKALAAALPKMVMAGGEITIGVPVLGFAVIGMAWVLATDFVGVHEFLRKFLPNQAKDLAEVGMVYQRDGRLLFRAMGIVMLICSVIFTLALRFGYGMTWVQSIGNGIALGVTGGVMFIGGFINYVIGCVIGSASFGWTTTFASFMVMIWAVHHMETGLFTPWAMGKSLGVRYLGVILCLLCGTVIMGPGISGIMVGLLLIPYYKGVWTVVGEPKPVAG